MLTTPVLLLIFNRKEPTQKVFEQIRIAKPQKLYIAADGPRKSREDDPKKCAETREIVKNIDWECEVKTLFREENLGCRNAVSSAITWFFENEEMGIILEDDCLPDQTFFTFCQENLIKYKDDERIMHIGGSNFQHNQKRGSASYYFSKFYHIWGWASWRRAWSKYDRDMQDYDTFIKEGVLENIFPNDQHMVDYWKSNFDLVAKKGFDTWDYQWIYAILKNNGLGIVPNSNLISNIGFNKDATHTVYENNSLSNQPVQSIYKVEHPLFVHQNYKADLYSRATHFYIPLPDGSRGRTNLAWRVERKLKRIFKKLLLRK